jgi:FixJ family two-component response regulator
MIPANESGCEEVGPFSPGGSLKAARMESTLVAAQYLISIIDDDESLRAALVELIGSLGHEARGFCSAEEFLASGAMSSFDCIITDIHMSGMSGFDLKKALAGRRCTVPVIMITARSDPALEGRAFAAGAIAFLRKPFEADTLIACLDRAVEM